jgi:excinuclease ABC subunit A
MGTFTSAQRYVMETFSKSQSAMMKQRVSRFMLSSDCPLCLGKRLRTDALDVTFAGMDITGLSRVPLKQLEKLLQPFAMGQPNDSSGHAEKVLAAQRITHEAIARLRVLIDLGLGYLNLERNTPTLSPGELQRLRLATQLHSNLFGVVYVLDEPSAGLHPSDTRNTAAALDTLKRSATRFSWWNTRLM